MSAEPIDDGGSAFPVPPPIAETDGVSMQWSHAEPGMTLRDWFAGKALSGLLADPIINQNVSFSTYAAACYDMADAMIAERKGGAE